MNTINKLQAIQALIDKRFGDPSLTPFFKGEDFNSNSYSDASFVDDVKNIMSLDDTLQFAPEYAKEVWRDIEVNPMATVHADGSTEPIDHAEQAEFWTVFLNNVSKTEPGRNWIADLPTEKAANDLAELLKVATKSYAGNDREQPTRGLLETIYNLLIGYKARVNRNHLDYTRLNEVLPELKTYLQTNTGASVGK